MAEQQYDDAMIDDVEADLREREDEINSTVRDMGQLRGEYAFTLRKLHDSYYPRLFPYVNAVHMNQYYQTLLSAEIEWLEHKVVAMEQHKGSFFELRDLALPKKQLFDALKPAFDEALYAMEKVSREELAVLRKYENPPQIVLDTISTVMAVRGEEDTSLEAAKVVLSETYYYSFFVSKCRNRIKSELSPEQADVLERYLLNPESDPEKVSRASGPCGAMAAWLRALNLYFHYEKITQPTKESLDDVKSRLMELRLKLQEKKEDIRGAQEKLAELNAEMLAAEKQLRDRYDCTMEPLHATFLEAHKAFHDTFASPRRRADDDTAF